MTKTQILAIRSTIESGVPVDPSRAALLIEEIERLREAVKPLAAEGTPFDGLADGAAVRVPLVVADVRRAREVLGVRAGGR